MENFTGLNSTLCWFIVQARQYHCGGQFAA